MVDLFKRSSGEEEEDPSSSDMEAKELAGKTFEREVSVSSLTHAAAGSFCPRNGLSRQLKGVKLNIRMPNVNCIMAI